MRLSRVGIPCVAVLLVAVPAMAANCTKCGKRLNWGRGTCLDCKKKALGAGIGKAKEGLRRATDQTARGIGETIGRGVNAYEESRKPEWQKFLESPTGMAVAVVVGGIFLLAVISSLRRKSPPSKDSPG